MNLLVLLAFKSCVSFWFLRNSLLFQNLAGFEYFQAKEIAFCSVCTREPWDVLEDRRDKWDLDPGIVLLEIGRPGLTECTSVSNIQTNQILMTKQSKKVPTFSNMNLFFPDIYLLSCPGSLLWKVDSISLIRDHTWAFCIGSSESSPLDHQQSPPHMIFCISNIINSFYEEK